MAQTVGGAFTEAFVPLANFYLNKQAQARQAEQDQMRQAMAIADQHLAEQKFQFDKSQWESEAPMREARMKLLDAQVKSVTPGTPEYEEAKAARDRQKAIDEAQLAGYNLENAGRISQQASAPEQQRLNNLLNVFKLQDPDSLGRRTDQALALLPPEQYAAHKASQLPILMEGAKPTEQTVYSRPYPQFGVPSVLQEQPQAQTIQTPPDPEQVWSEYMHSYSPAMEAKLARDKALNDASADTQARLNAKLELDKGKAKLAELDTQSLIEHRRNMDAARSEGLLIRKAQASKPPSGGSGRKGTLTDNAVLNYNARMYSNGRKRSELASKIEGEIPTILQHALSIDAAAAAQDRIAVAAEEARDPMGAAKARANAAQYRALAVEKRAEAETAKARSLEIKREADEWYKQKIETGMQVSQTGSAPKAPVGSKKPPTTEKFKGVSDADLFRKLAGK